MNKEPQELMDEYYKLGSWAQVAVLGFMTGWLAEAARLGGDVGRENGTILAEARRAALDSLYKGRG